ncbi:hypothetical protein FALBO_4190 [Fusarium albosuccineum]|uniref:Uncharacterized protein n=1 Tax=Fusarium albosuccineum TaxID=1237068 RepID=A0A8H4PGK6_9HYPO|nr:hypothetical protein FALBO_4190 [Fusarium albosuccineum]
MQKVEEPEEEDPFDEEDPFSAGCESEKAACLQREADLQVQLSQSQSDISEMKEAIEASCPSKHGKYAFVSGQEYRFWCARHHDPSNPKETYSNVATIADCVKICNSKTWCRWVHHGIYQTVCNLFDVNTSHTTQPAQSTVGWNSAVKK